MTTQGTIHREALTAKAREVLDGIQEGEPQVRAVNSGVGNYGPQMADRLAVEDVEEFLDRYQGSNPSRGSSHGMASGPSTERGM